MVEPLPVLNFQVKFGVLSQEKSAVLVILNLPSLNPGGAGIGTAVLKGVAIAANIRICLLVALMFELGARCTVGKEASADPA